MLSEGAGGVVVLPLVGAAAAGSWLLALHLSNPGHWLPGSTLNPEEPLSQGPVDELDVVTLTSTRPAAQLTGQLQSVLSNVTVESTVMIRRIALPV